MEIWKDIKGFEGLYQVSNYGNVKSLNYNKTGKECILKNRKRYDGYCSIRLCNKTVKTFSIHRLVAEAFIPNPNNLPEVNHRDEDKTNNNVTNLEWCDKKYNINYGTRTEKTSKQVLCVETGVIYQSLHNIERELNFSRSSIRKCCINKLKTAYGYHWEYIA